MHLSCFVVVSFGFAWFARGNHCLEFTRLQEETMFIFLSAAVDVVPILPHQAELQEVVGEEEDGESLSSPSPSATAKSPPGTTPESSSLQVQHTQLMSTPSERPY